MVMSFCLSLRSIIPRIIIHIRHVLFVSRCHEHRCVARPLGRLAAAPWFARALESIRTTVIIARSPPWTFAPGIAIELHVGKTLASRKEALSLFQKHQSTSRSRLTAIPHSRPTLLSHPTLAALLHRSRKGKVEEYEQAEQSRKAQNILRVHFSRWSCLEL